MVFRIKNQNQRDSLAFSVSLRETPSFTRLKIEENIKAKNKDEIQRPNLRRNTKEKIKTKYKDQREGYENMFQLSMVLVCAKLAP